jgi:hypothetical protein
MFIASIYQSFVHGDDGNSNSSHVLFTKSLYSKKTYQTRSLYNLPSKFLPTGKYLFTLPAAPLFTVLSLFSECTVLFIYQLHLAANNSEQVYLRLRRSFAGLNSFARAAVLVLCVLRPFSEKRRISRLFTRGQRRERLG